MKLPTLWRTSHGINRAVIEAISKGTGFPVRDTELLVDNLQHTPAISYGILRGTSAAYATAQNNGLDWYELDNGYFRRGHFDGYYRISRNGLTVSYDRKLADHLNFDRWRSLGFVIRDWVENRDGHFLVCPPTDAIEQFYGLEAGQWEINTVRELSKHGRMIKVRRKDAGQVPLSDDLRGCFCVVTFNSNVALDALLEGIPAVTSEFHPVHSWNGISIDNINERNLYAADRLSLFKYLSHFQYRLEELEKPKAWQIIFKLLGSSVDIPGFFTKEK